MHTTSLSLLERVRQPGEPQAWARFVELYTPLLFHWARRAGLQEPDAADLVQDVFLTLVRKLPEFAFDPARSFRAWLRAVTLNQWRDNLKRRDRRPLPANPAALETAEAPEEVAFWEVEYRRRLVDRALEIMRAEFQPATWQACWQVVVEGRPAAEVARELGISENAVYIARCRVLRRLRGDLEGLLE
jgi:RNA polymerase sigma-70 factor (ECF subfamily)